MEVTEHMDTSNGPSYGSLMDLGSTLFHGLGREEFWKNHKVVFMVWGLKNFGRITREETTASSCCPHGWGGVAHRYAARRPRCRHEPRPPALFAGRGIEDLGVKLMDHMQDAADHLGMPCLGLPLPLYLLLPPKVPSTCR